MHVRLFLAAAVLALCLPLDSGADEFTAEDMQRWQDQFMQVVQEGRALWTSGEIGTNGVACAQCHPNATNTHPETYPKFQKQMGRVVAMWEKSN